MKGKTRKPDALQGTLDLLVHRQQSKSADLPPHAGRPENA
jgi:hypothetical protein